MDRASYRFRRSLLVFLILAGCVSNSPKNATDNSNHNPSSMNCSGTECAIGAGAMLLISVLVSPPKGGAAAERKQAKSSISGYCELQEPGKSKPCQGVLLTLKAPGYSRKAWIMDNNFEVTGIKAAKFDIEAYSEEYETATTLKNVLVGSQIKIQLVVPGK